MHSTLNISMHKENLLMVLRGLAYGVIEAESSLQRPALISDMQNGMVGRLEAPGRSGKRQSITNIDL